MTELIVRACLCYRIEDLNRLFSVFLGYLHDLACISDSRQMTQIIAKQASSLVPCIHCKFFVTEKGSQRLVTYIVKESSKITASEEVYEEIHVPISCHTVIGQVAMSGEALHVSVKLCSF